MNLTPIAASPAPFSEMNLGNSIPMVKLCNMVPLSLYLDDNELGDLRWNRADCPRPPDNTSSYRRVGCIADGNCLFHAVAKGLSEIYQLSYKMWGEITEATLRKFEESVGENVIFPSEIFYPGRNSNLNTEYKFVSKDGYDYFRKIMVHFRMVYVKMLRQDFANRVLTDPRMHQIILKRLGGSIEERIDTTFREELLKNPRYQYLPEKDIDTIVSHYVDRPLNERIDMLIALFMDKQLKLTPEQIRSWALQEVKNELAQELLNLDEAVQPDFLILLADFVDVDIYLLRDHDLSNPKTTNTPLYGGTSIHVANLGQPQRKAIVIISIDDTHYEIVARVDVDETENIIRRHINPSMVQEEPLIQRLYQMLTELRSL